MQRSLLSTNQSYIVDLYSWPSVYTQRSRAVLGTQPETSCLSSLRGFCATIINHHDPIRLFIFLDSSWPGMRESAFFAGRLRPGAAAIQLLPDLMVLSPDFLSLPLATADFTVGDIFYDKRRVVIVQNVEFITFQCLSSDMVGIVEFRRIRIYKNLDCFNYIYFH